MQETWSGIAGHGIPKIRERTEGVCLLDSCLKWGRTCVTTKPLSWDEESTARADCGSKPAARGLEKLVGQGHRSCKNVLQNERFRALKPRRPL